MAAKAELRAQILAARRALPEHVRQLEARRLRDHLTDVIGLAHRDAPTVCAYVPVGPEPGSQQMLDRLAELCGTVLLPVTAGTDEPLRWAEYVPGRLVTGRFGLREPAGPRSAPDEVARADLVLVPALAVDRAGARLGRGGGFYDRSLPLCSPGTALVAVVRDSEVLGEVPRDRHDVRMTHALTPGEGLIAL